VLVGDYTAVAGYLARYVAAGVSVVLLGAVYSADDFRCADRVMRKLRAGPAVEPREPAKTPDSS
jgi:hypothetical protein